MLKVLIDFPATVISGGVCLFCFPTGRHRARFKVLINQLFCVSRAAESYFDRMVLRNLAEGIGRGRTNRSTVHLHVRDKPSCIGRDGKGFALPIVDLHRTGRVDLAAFAGCCGDGVDLGGILDVDLDVIQPEGGAVLALVDEGKLDALRVLEFFRNGHLRLCLFPRAKLIFLVPIPQLPDLLPVCAVVSGSHDLQVVVVVRNTPIVIGVEVEDNTGLGRLFAQVNGRADEPLVLLLGFGAIDNGHFGTVLRALVPGLVFHRGFYAPAFRWESGFLEIFCQHRLGGDDHFRSIGVALGLDGVNFPVAGVVVDHDFQVLAETGDVILALGGGPSGRLGHGEAGQLLALGVVGDGHVGDELVVCDLQADIVFAVLIGNRDVLGLRLFRVDGDGEGPGGFLVVGHVLIVRQLTGNCHDNFVVVFQLRIAILLRTAPRELVVVRGSGGDDLIIVAAVDRLGFVVYFVAVIDVPCFGVFDLIVEGLDVPQQTGIDKAQGVHVVIPVGRDGIALRGIGLSVVIGVVAQVGVDGAFQRVGSGGVDISLGPVVLLIIEHVAVIGGVDDGGLGPVAVEAHVGDGQGVLGVGSGGQGDEALDVSPIFKTIEVLIVSLGQANRDRNRFCLAAGYGHSLGIDLAQQVGQLRNLMHVLALDLLGHFLCVGLNITTDGVGQFLIGQIVDLKLDLILSSLLRIVTQLDLGAATAYGGQIGLGRSGSGDVHAAGALFPGGIGGGAGHDQVGGAHEQVADQIGLFRLGGSIVFLLHILLHQGHGTGDEGGGHRRTALRGVAATGRGRLDVAAGGREIRLERQLRRNAPGGEVRHFPGGGVVHLAVGSGNRQLTISFCHCRQRLAVGLGDERAGQVVVVHLHVQHTRLVIVHQNTCCTSGLRCFFLCVILYGATGHQSNLALDAQAIVVLRFTCIGHDHVFQLLTRQGTEAGRIVFHVLYGLVFHSVVEGNLALPYRQIAGVNAVGFLHAGDGQRLAVAGGAGDGAVVRVLGQGVALADAGPQGSAVLVAGGDGEHHATAGDVFQHLCHTFFPLRGAEAAGGA